MLPGAWAKPLAWFVESMVESAILGEASTEWPALSSKYIGETSQRGCQEINNSFQICYSTCCYFVSNG